MTYVGSWVSSFLSYLSPVLPYFSSIVTALTASSTSSSSIPYSQIVREFKTKHSIFESAQNSSVFMDQSFGRLMDSDRCIFVYFHNGSSSCSRFAEQILSHELVVDYLRV